MNKLLQQARLPIWCFLIAMTLIGIGVAADWVFNTLLVTIFFWSAATIPFAFALYRMRGRSRVIYGVFELTIAFGVLYVSMLTIIHTPQPISFELVITRMLAIFVALYFMVRALDNIGEGLPRDSKAHVWWQKRFPKVR